MKKQTRSAAAQSADSKLRPRASFKDRSNGSQSQKLGQNGSGDETHEGRCEQLQRGAASLERVSLGAGLAVDRGQRHVCIRQANQTPGIAGQRLNWNGKLNRVSNCTRQEDQTQLNPATDITSRQPRLTGFAEEALLAHRDLPLVFEVDLPTTNNRFAIKPQPAGLSTRLSDG